MSQTLQTICIVIISAVIGFLLCVLYFNKQLDVIHNELSQRPKIVVADYMKIAENFPAGAPPAEIEKAMAEYSMDIRRLGEQGVLVISGQGVSYAPETFVIPPRNVK